MKAHRLANLCLVLFLLFAQSSSASAVDLWSVVEFICEGILFLLVSVWYILGFVGIGAGQLISSWFGKKRPKSKMRKLLRMFNLFFTPLSGLVFSWLFLHSVSGGVPARTNAQSGGAGGGLIFFILFVPIISCLCAYGLNLLYVAITEPEETGKRELWYDLSCGNWRF